MLNITNLPDIDRRDVSFLVMAIYYHLSRWHLGDKLTHHEKESIAYIVDKIARLNVRIQTNGTKYANGEISGEESERKLNYLTKRVSDICMEHNLRYECDNDVAGIRLYNGEHELTFLLNE